MVRKKKLLVHAGKNSANLIIRRIFFPLAAILNTWYAHVYSHVFPGRNGAGRQVFFVYIQLLIDNFVEFQAKSYKLLKMSINSVFSMFILNGKQVQTIAIHVYF